VPRIIEGVAFDGKVWCAAGTRPYFAPEQRCAAIEACEFKYKPLLRTVSVLRELTQRLSLLGMPRVTRAGRGLLAVLLQRFNPNPD
jgi:hypothetical protein